VRQESLRIFGSELVPLAWQGRREGRMANQHNQRYRA
jgi:hypothetical protein